MVKSKVINADELDNSTLLHLIQAAYKKGYDNISVEFSDKDLIDYKKGITEDVNVVVEKTVKRLYGMKIKEATDNSIKMEYTGPGAYGTVSVVLKQIFDTLLTLSEEVLVHSQKDVSVLTYTKERHDLITKFSSFCLRLINLLPSNNASLYHLLSIIDKLVDGLKYTSSQIQKVVESLESAEQNIEDDDVQIYTIGFKVNECISLMKNYFDTPDDKKLFVKFSKIRRSIRKQIEQKYYSSEEMEILMQWVNIVDLSLEAFETISIK